MIRPSRQAFQWPHADEKSAVQWHRCPRSDESTVGCAVLQLSENNNDSPSYFSLRLVNELAGSLIWTERGSSRGDRRTGTKEDLRRRHTKRERKGGRDGGERSLDTIISA